MAPNNSSDADKPKTNAQAPSDQPGAVVQPEPAENTQPQTESTPETSQATPSETEPAAPAEPEQPQQTATDDTTEPEPTPASADAAPKPEPAAETPTEEKPQQEGETSAMESTTPTSEPVVTSNDAASPEESVTDTTAPGEPAAAAPGTSIAPESLETTSPLVPTTQATDPSSAETSQPTTPKVFGQETPFVSEQPDASTQGAAVGGVAANAQPKKRKKFFKFFLIAAATVAVLGGGSAAAYFGIVVPNKPENVLMSAVLNSIQETEIAFEGKVEGEPTEAGGIVYKAVYDGKASSAKHALETNMTVTVMGVDIAGSVRYIDESAYVKLGDLSVIAGMASSIDPSYGQMILSMNDKVANKWFEIDSTLLKQAGLSCIMESAQPLKNSDLELLKEQYQKHPFVTIKGVADDMVNGAKVQKFEILIDDDKGAAFVKGLNKLSIAKTVNSCDIENSGYNSNELADHDTTPLTLWVDKSTQHVVKVTAHTSNKDEKEMKYKATISTTMQYKPVTITAPEKSTPIMQLVGPLQSQLNGSMSSGVQAKTKEL